MAKASVGAIRLIDSDGDALDDGDGKLNVNATLVAGASIDIGDVEILGHGTVAHFALNVRSGINGPTQLISRVCKHADIMANLSNTDVIYIGASGVSSTNGIALNAGDVYSVDVTNTNLLYALAIVDNEDINVVTYS